MKQTFIHYSDTELEAIVLGTIIIESNALDRVTKDFAAQLFYDDKHQLIAKFIIEMHSKGIPVDMVTLVQYATKANALNQIGGALGIAELTQKVASSAHLESHMAFLKEKYIMRSLLALSSKIQTSLANNDEVSSVIAHALKGIEQIEDSAYSSNGIQMIDDCIKQSLEDLYTRVDYNRKGISPGITTGLKDLDIITNGWQKGKLIVLAARPAMGKTAFAMKFAKEAAIANKHVAFFSLEMDAVSLSDRLILSESQIESWRYQSGRLNDQELATIDQDIAQLLKLNISIDDNTNNTIRKIESQCRYLKKNKGCDLVIIDYLQLVESDEKTYNREQEIASISRGAKKLARALEVPVILLSQLSRKVEERQVKRPLLSDLRESGAIEQDADMVLFLYRPEYYKDSENQPLMLEVKNKGEVPRGIEIIVAKNRNASVGSAICQHDGTLNKIFDWEDNQIKTPF